MIAVKLEFVERMAVAVAVMDPLHVGQAGRHRHALVLHPPRSIIVALHLIAASLQCRAVRRVVGVAALWPERRVGTARNKRVVNRGVDVCLLFERQPDDITHLVATAPVLGTVADVADSARWATTACRVHGFQS